MVADGGEEDYLWGRGRPWGVGCHLNAYNPLKGPRSVPNVLCSFPLNGSLVSFVIIIITNELFPLMLSHPYFRWMRSLHLLPWSITPLYTLHKV